MAEIHLRTQGIPRVINGVCDNLLLTAFAMETKVCTVEMLDEVCQDMRLDWPGSRRACAPAQRPGILRADALQGLIFGARRYRIHRARYFTICTASRSFSLQMYSMMLALGV